jgi:branched-chain amino acid transport system substrate-binding protein
MRRMLAGMVGATLAATLVAGQAIAQDPGVTPGEIKIGMWTPLSGPLSLLGQSARDGVSVWVREVNEKGGIHGRKVTLVAYDDGASPQEAQAAVRRLIGQDRVFMLIAGSSSGSTLPVRELITREKVPFVSSISSNMNLMNPPSRYIFRIYANENVQAGSITDWMIEKEGIKRPAIIYNSNDYGVGGFRVFEQRLSSKFNMKPVAAERYNPGDQDFSAQLLRIKGATPDGLLVFAFAAEAGIIVRQARELGIQAKMFGGGGTATNLFQRGAGPAAEGFAADFVVPHFPDSDHPGVTAYRSKLRDWFHPGGFPPGRPSEYDLAAYAAGKVTEAALQRIGPNPTREAFVDALEGLRGFETGVSFPISYSKDSHEGTDQVLVIRVNKELKWEPHPAAKSAR